MPFYYRINTTICLSIQIINTCNFTVMIILVTEFYSFVHFSVLMATKCLIHKRILVFRCKILNSSWIGFGRSSFWQLHSENHVMSTVTNQSEGSRWCSLLSELWFEGKNILWEENWARKNRKYFTEDVTNCQRHKDTRWQKLYWNM